MSGFLRHHDVPSAADAGAEFVVAKLPWSLQNMSWLHTLGRGRVCFCSIPWKGQESANNAIRQDGAPDRGIQEGTGEEVC